MQDDPKSMEETITRRLRHSIDLRQFDKNKEFCLVELDNNELINITSKTKESIENLSKDILEKYDGNPSFGVLPDLILTFLSGTFYLVDKLPEPFRSASHFNPFFYLIDGFRYGFIGHADGSIAIGVVSMGVLTTGLFLWCWRLFVTGYRLKS